MTEKTNEDKAAILYVDDEKGNLISFKATFRNKYNVFTAISAEKGMEILESEPIELIITDQRMPEMTGVQFLESIISSYPDVTRMILTGFSDTEAIIQAINSGRVYRYITKPWDANELEMIIEAGISRYRMERKNNQIIKELRDQISEKSALLDIFQQYVPENIIQQASSETGISNDSEERVVSVLFAKLQNFHEITQNLLPDAKMHLLNQFMSLANQVVVANNGVINKYISDGFFAVFGAPISDIDNHKNAALCGLGLMRLIQTLDVHAVEPNVEEEGPKLTLVNTIDTAEALVGNVGAPNHLDYTVVGDIMRNVLLLNMLSQKNDNSLLVAENTYHFIKENNFLLKPFTLPDDSSIFDTLPKLYEIITLNQQEK